MCLVFNFGMQGVLSHFVHFYSPDICPGGNIHVFFFLVVGIQWCFIIPPFWIITVSEAHIKVQSEVSSS